MAKKLKKNIVPAGETAEDFRYQGRPAKTQDDFGLQVGIADMACVNAFGEVKNSKRYHAGVVKSEKTGTWWVYLEWGPIKKASSASWEHGPPGNFMFVECTGEADARKFFEKQSRSKNIKRLQEKEISGKTIWTAKEGKDGYLVQSLALRMTGLPDAHTIVDDALVESKDKKKKKNSKKSSSSFHPQEIKLAQDLVGGVQTYTRSTAAASGVTPTQTAIDEVRELYIPLALKAIKRIGNSPEKQIADQELIDITKYVSAVIPRPVTKNPYHQILSADNITSLQQDLDTFEAFLASQDFDIESEETNPHELLGASVSWVDPKSKKGRWLKETFISMSNNRHHYIGKGNPKVINIFEVSRPSLDKRFTETAEKIAKECKRWNGKEARLQPVERNDLTDISRDVISSAKVFLGIHGTRAVNIQPILSSNLRLPTQLPGAQITGAAFGHGIYFATDWRKSYGYTGHSRSYYGSGGQIRGRGFFMFLTDVIMGKPYMTRRTGSWKNAPDNCHSVFAHCDVASVANDEHIIFNPNQQRIRYIIEGEI